MLLFNKKMKYIHLRMYTTRISYYYHEQLLYNILLFIAYTAPIINTERKTLNSGSENSYIVKYINIRIFTYACKHLQKISAFVDKILFSFCIAVYIFHFFQTRLHSRYLQPKYKVNNHINTT